MSKRLKRLRCDCSQRMCRRCCEECRLEENLYLVVDWSSGCSIRKIDLLSDSDGGAMRCLPPPILRMVAERGAPKYCTAGFGAKIVMLQAKPSETAVQLIDVNALAVMPGPDICCPCSPIYIPVGSDKLFIMDVCTFEICSQPKPDGMSASLAQDKWLWSDLQEPPFDTLEVSSYTVDNQEQTIFVSTKGATDEATYTFDIGESVWKLYGNWSMPFDGRGYYDCDLDGFVGISKHPETLGYLYFCDMKTRSRTSGKLRRFPDVKCSKVKVFNKNRLRDM